MITALVDRIAHRYATGYSQFLRALSGVVSSAMTSADALEPKTSSILVIESFEVAAEFINSHQMYIDGEIVMLEAIRDAGALDADDEHIIREHCWMSWAAAQDLLNEATARDRAEARTVFRRFAFDASLRAATHGKVGGLITARLKHMPIKASFTKEDRAGRGWSAPVHVRTLVRAALLGVYVDAYLFTLLANGVNKARVVYEDAEHENHELVFSIDGSDPDLQTLEDIRATVFHPNSTAKLEAVEE